MCLLLVIFLLSFASAAIAVGAPLKLASVFSDSMVLQRNVPVTIWGTAEPASSITVSFAEQLKKTKADANGKWSVQLDSMPASAKPHDLEIAAANTITLHEVLVGEVWIAAGQSNMEFPLARELHAATEIRAAHLPMVRLLNLSFAGQSVFGKPFGPEILSRLNTDRFYTGAWAPCTPATAKPFSAIGYYFAKDLQDQLNIPIGIINMAVGGSPTEAWIRRDAMAGNPQLSSLVQGNWLTTPPLDDWCKQRGRENLGDHVNSTDPSGPVHAFKPGFLWDAGIARLIPFPIAGVIWYQGESNSLDQPRIIQHEELFKTLVTDWRKSWGIGQFPFLYCQLSGIATENYNSQYWPEFRDQQRRLLSKLPDTAMAVTSDYGNKADVHPREKREIGKRLSAAAMALAYRGKEEWQGPLVDNVSSDKMDLIAKFTHTTGGLIACDHSPVRGFEVAGADGRYYPANVIANGSTVRLNAPQVPDPVSVRYDWQPYPDGNLINAAGFPCSTFKISCTDVH